MHANPNTICKRHGSGAGQVGTCIMSFWLESSGHPCRSCQASSAVCSCPLLHALLIIILGVCQHPPSKGPTTH
jgi:hypothetical protein